MPRVSHVIAALAGALAVAVPTIATRDHHPAHPYGSAPDGTPYCGPSTAGSPPPPAGGCEFRP